MLLLLVPFRDGAARAALGLFLFVARGRGAADGGQLANIAVCPGEVEIIVDQGRRLLWSFQDGGVGMEVIFENIVKLKK